MVLNPEMASRGLSPQLMNVTKQIICPRCGKTFSLFQSRAIACVGCPRSNTGCKYARCIHCDVELPLTAEPNRAGEKNISNYLNGIVNDYSISVGKTRHR